jgi:hypothetical protein
MEHDIVKVKLRPVKRPSSAKGKPNYEIVKVQPVKD